MKTFLVVIACILAPWLILGALVYARLAVRAKAKEEARPTLRQFFFWPISAYRLKQNGILWRDNPADVVPDPTLFMTDGKYDSGKSAAYKREHHA